MKNLWKMVGIVFAVSLVFGLTGCSDDDDSSNAIGGGNKHYSVDYNNESAETYRAYNSTVYKHTGGTIKVTMNKANASCGAMGFMFDKKDHKESKTSSYERAASVKNPQDFFVVAVNYKYASNAGLAYYISKFENITDINEYNFGAPDIKSDDSAIGEGETGKAGDGNEYTSNSKTHKSTVGAKETSIVAAYTAITVDDESTITNADGNIEFVINVVGKDKEGKPGADLNAGEFKVSIYKTSDLEADGKTVKTDATPLVSKVITGAQTGYAGEKDGLVPQNYLAVYANILSGKHLTGTWDFLGDYNCVDVIDE